MDRSVDLDCGADVCDESDVRGDGGQCDIRDGAVACGSGATLSVCNANEDEGVIPCGRVKHKSLMLRDSATLLMILRKIAAWCIWIDRSIARHSSFETALAKYQLGMKRRKVKVHGDSPKFGAKYLTNWFKVITSCAGLLPDNALETRIIRLIDDMDIYEDLSERALTRLGTPAGYRKFVWTAKSVRTLEARTRCVVECPFVDLSAACGSGIGVEQSDVKDTCVVADIGVRVDAGSCIDDTLAVDVKQILCGISMSGVPIDIVDELRHNADEDVTMRAERIKRVFTRVITCFKSGLDECGYVDDVTLSSWLRVMDRLDQAYSSLFGREAVFTVRDMIRTHARPYGLLWSCGVDVKRKRPLDEDDESAAAEMMKSTGEVARLGQSGRADIWMECEVADGEVGVDDGCDGGATMSTVENGGACGFCNGSRARRATGAGGRRVRRGAACGLRYGRWCIGRR